MRMFVVPSQFYAAPASLRKHRMCVSVFFLLIFQLIPCTRVHAVFNDQSDQAASPSSLPLPSAYGKVIYSFNENNPKKVYIVGISHRSSRSRLNGGNTARTQAEVYRIGEWLSQNKKIDLLMPEGFFDNASAVPGSCPVGPNTPLDSTTLDRKLQDDTSFVNAEMLLMEHCQIPACQIEDPQLYDAVLTKLISLQENADNPDSCLMLQDEIETLQERRTTAILQKIPAAIESNYQKGTIKSENALFTIGLNHIGTIINSLEKNKIRTQATPSPSVAARDTASDLDLLKNGFGIIIIIPQTLAHDREALRITRLDGIM